MPKLFSHVPSLAVSVGVQTHVGKQRTENQDRVTRAATPFGDLFVVADGVGGYRGGAEAAQSTADGFVRFLAGHGNLMLKDALQQAVHTVSGDLLQRSTSDPALHHMGSTVVLCVIQGTRATYAHAGDSRAYLVRNGRLRQLTRDHSVMERFVAQGVLTPAQAREHADASVLTRALGQSADVSLDIGELELEPNDCLLLCSDGLWAYAREPEIEAVAASSSLSASGVASALLNLALEGGGGDNISVQFLRFSAIAPARRGATILGRPLKIALPVITLATMVGVGALGTFVWNYYHPIYPRDSAPVSPATSPAATIPPRPAQPQPRKPAVTPPVANPPAPARTARANTNAHPGKVKVVIVRDGNGRSAKWAGELANVPNVNAPVHVNGTDACLGRQTTKDTLFYAPHKADVAKRAQTYLHPQPDIVEMAKADLDACGGGDLIAMPASSRPDQPVVDVLGSIESKIKSGEDAAKKAGEKAKDHIPVTIPDPNPQP